MTTLLMTGTIDSGYFGNISTKVTDIDERKKQYYETIEKYIKESNFDNIIFAENSQYSFDSRYFIELANQYNKKFEYVKVYTDIQKTQKYGKSYGEAHLISQAVQNSKIIKGGVQVFYKVTGRVFVKNINQLINERKENLFITRIVDNTCLTVFFKVQVDVLKKCLLGSEEKCNELEGNSIEVVYFNALKNEKVRCFKRYPDLSGIIGSQGKPYDRRKSHLFAMNVLNKLGYYSYKKRYIFNDKKVKVLRSIASKLLRN